MDNIRIVLVFFNDARSQGDLKEEIFISHEIFLLVVGLSVDAVKSVFYPANVYFICIIYFQTVMKLNFISAVTYCNY